MEFKDTVPTNGTNLSTENEAQNGGGPQPNEPNQQTAQPAEEPANLFAQPPDMPRRVFEVTLLKSTDDGQQIVERVEGHVAFTEQGALVIQQAVSNTLFVVRVFAPYEWLTMKAAPPTRKQLEIIARATDAFYRQQVELQNRVQRANAGSSPIAGSAVVSGRQLLNRIN